MSSNPCAGKYGAMRSRDIIPPAREIKLTFALLTGAKINLNKQCSGKNIVNAIISSYLSNHLAFNGIVFCLDFGFEVRQNSSNA